MRTFDIPALCTGLERKLSFFTFVALKKSKFRTVLRKFAKSRFRKYFMFTKFIQRFSFPRKFRKPFRQINNFFAKKQICSSWFVHFLLYNSKTFIKTTILAKIFEKLIFSRTFSQKFYQSLYNISYTEKRKTVCSLYIYLLHRDKKDLVS